MSDAVWEYYANRFAGLNTVAQAKYGRTDERLFLLERTSQAGTYDQIEELTEGIEIIPDKVRDAIFFFYSTTSDFADTWARTTHLGFGIPDNENKVFVFEIQPEQKDKFLPDVSNHDWKAFATRSGNERHEIVEIYYFTSEGNRWATDGNYWVI